MSRAKKHFFLSREDLIESKKLIPINEVTLWDFKTSSISFRQIIHAKLIVFCESLYDGKGTHGNAQRVLKDKKGDYFNNLTFKDFRDEQN